MAKQDTLLVPAHPKNCKSYFLESGYWYGISFKKSLIHILKYLAIYETKPISAITYYAEIERFEEYVEINKKFRIYVRKGTITKLDPPIHIEKPSDGIQSTRVISSDDLLTAKTIGDLFRKQ